MSRRSPQVLLLLLRETLIGSRRFNIPTASAGLGKIDLSHLPVSLIAAKRTVPS